MDSNENETIAKSGDSGQGVIIFTYIIIVLSIFAMGFNFWMTLYIGNYYPKQKEPHTTSKELIVF